MIKLLNKWDIAVIVLTFISSIALFFVANSFNMRNSPVAQVYYDSELVASLNLDKDTIYVLKKSRYPGLYGDFEIEVKDGKVHILKEVCPQGICVDLGWTDSSAKSLICLPNKIFVKIENDNPESDVMLK